MSPRYMLKLKIAQKSQPLISVRSVEPIDPNFRRMLSSVIYFLCLLENSFSSLLTKTFYNFMGFFIKLNTVNFNM